MRRGGQAEREGLAEARYRCISCGDDIYCCQWQGGGAIAEQVKVKNTHVGASGAGIGS